MWFKIVTAIVLIAIAYEDFSHRLVRILFYGILLVLLISWRYSNIVVPLELFVDIVFNLIYIVLLLGICSAVMYLRYGEFNLFRRFLGLGDVLLLTALACWFDPLTFILFNALSFLIALIVDQLLRKIFTSYKRFHSVPLAGIQSLCFLPVIIIVY